MIDFPTRNQIEKGINKVAKLEFPEYEIGSDPLIHIRSISKLLISNLGFKPPMIFKPLKSFNFKIFRARLLDEYKNIELISEHSYCPSNLAVNYGRCHVPGYPVFYCSNDPVISILELIKENDFKDKRICLSSWELHSSSEEIILNPFIFNELDMSNEFQELKYGTMKKLGELLNNEGISKEQIEGIEIYLEFICELFVKDDNYLLSSFFAHNYLFASHNLKTDILIYSSIQSKHKGVNMAINPNFVDKLMIPKRFYIVDLKDIDRERWDIVFDISKYGYLNRNTIVWKDLTQGDEIFDEFLKKDFNKPFITN